MRLLTTDQAVIYLAKNYGIYISRWTLQRWRKSLPVYHSVPAYRHVGGVAAYAVADLDSWAGTESALAFTPRYASQRHTKALSRRRGSAYGSL